MAAGAILGEMEWNMRVVIVGGVAGGASAAVRARRLSESAQIIVFERGPDVSFANCGLPYYIGGEIADRGKLLVVKPELLIERFRLDVRTRTEVTKIDRQRKVVHVHELATDRIYEEPYDKLILSPGAAPLRPPIKGINLPGVVTIRALEDVDRIKKIMAEGIQRAVVVGAGFIGLEVTENLVNQQIATTLVELQDQVLPPLDAEMAQPIADCLRRHGVDLRLGQSAEMFTERPEGIAVQLKNGDVIVAQLVILGIGVRPENKLAVESGLEVGPRGGIVVDAHMRTNDPDIYAVGDAVQVQGFVLNQPTQVPLGGPANRQGRIAADHIFGRDSRYRGTQGTAIVKAFEQVAGLTGESEKSLRRAGRSFAKIYVHPGHHAGYYPGARPLTIKLLFDPGDGQVLGAQVVGEAGVDKRIDVLAMAIQGRMTVFDLEEVELAYAPQFGSAKDPINMAGFVAANIVRGDYRQIYAENLEEMVGPARQQQAVILDVRTEAEHTVQSIPGSLHVPLDSLRERLDEIPHKKPVIVYCAAGQRGYLATRLLNQCGFEAWNLAGGFKTYQMHRNSGSQPG